MFTALESSSHEVGSSFDYFAHGAVMGYARGCLCEYRPLSQTRPSFAFVSVCLPLSAHLSAISLKNSPLCDLILTKRVNSLKSILALSNSRISRRMFPSGDALMDGLIPSPIHLWIAIRRHLKSAAGSVAHCYLRMLSRPPDLCMSLRVLLYWRMSPLRLYLICRSLLFRLRVCRSF